MLFRIMQGLVEVRARPRPLPLSPQGSLSSGPAGTPVRSFGPDLGLGSMSVATLCPNLITNYFSLMSAKCCTRTHAMKHTQSRAFALQYEYEYISGLTVFPISDRMQC